MRVTIKVEDDHGSGTPSAVGCLSPSPTSNIPQASAPATELAGTADDSGSLHGVPAELAARAARIGALSAGSAPAADHLGLSAPGAPGFPAQVGASPAIGISTPTGATADDIPAGAAPLDPCFPTRGLR